MRAAPARLAMLLLQVMLWNLRFGEQLSLME